MARLRLTSSRCFPPKSVIRPCPLPYHLGNGWFGGLLPVIATALVGITKNIYAGLIFPIVVALMTVVVGWKYLRETNTVDISAEVEDRQIRTAPAASGAGPLAACFVSHLTQIKRTA